MRADVSQCVYALGPRVYVIISNLINLEVPSLLAAKLLVGCN